MACPALRRSTLLLLLCAALATPWAATAAPRNLRPAPTAAPAPLSRFWSFLQSLWGEEGCRMDPDGRCKTAATQPAPNTDTGCRMDPDGRCIAGTAQAPAPNTDTGCMMDPDGRCHS
ncbi:MAG TPA: hypothetical protein VFE33_14690 [Thermoanaerobaculia bacterium]|nr:hypothetical protein [Thermoanaerobaculia bacterium]